MRQVAPTDIYQPSSNLVVETALDGTLLLVPVDSEDTSGQPVLMTLNPVGLAIWKKLDGRLNLEEIIEALCRDFAGERQAIADDVLDFIDELFRKGLLVKVSTSSV